MDIFLNENQFNDVFESHIKIETYSKSIDSLFNSARSRNKINYKPYYQRNYVWDDSKASYFIESILLGTEIPPLIFFDEGKTTEVIDGRQRFETIERFLEGSFSLSKNGLTSLIDLAKMDINLLREEMPVIYEAFIDAKVRIIGFKLVNNPPSDPVLIDKVKKEIFGRYNSGITPLKKAEIDNAVYDSDGLSKYFKEQLKKNPSKLITISRLFLRQFESGNGTNVESVLQFIRKALVIYKFPIKTYAGGKSRTELISKFYEFNFAELEELQDIYVDFIKKVDLISEIDSKLSNESVAPNRLFFECLLWGINIVDQEEKDFHKLLDEENVARLQVLLNESNTRFDLTDSHYSNETLSRYKTMAGFFEDTFQICLSPYLQVDKSAKAILSDVVSTEKSYKEELEKLETLRITKPDPSRNTIDDLLRAMKRNRFLIRPSYQRSEVINLAKSSAIIESILLGIMLPAIFIYKRKDGVSEVIDGQQRLLTILGFIGEKYLDENGNYGYSKNHKFKLRSPRILRDLKGKGFEDLSDDFEDRILEFDLFVVEIEERLNPDFDPVDLFIRLNDKPFPIRENSFEMWNSWVDKDVVDQIKLTMDKNKEWFYIKNTSKAKFRDRMNNEELYTILAYFEFRKNKGSHIDSHLDIYQKGGRINARIKKKRDITSTLLEVSENNDAKSDFLFSIKSISRFLDKIQILLGANEPSKLKDNLEGLMSSGTNRRYYSRTLQDFYILWKILVDIPITLDNREKVHSTVAEIFSYMKNIPTEYDLDNKGYYEFNKISDSLAEVAKINSTVS